MIAPQIFSSEHILIPINMSVDNHFLLAD